MYFSKPHHTQINSTKNNMLFWLENGSKSDLILKGIICIQKKKKITLDFSDLYGTLKICALLRRN